MKEFTFANKTNLQDGAKALSEQSPIKCQGACHEDLQSAKTVGGLLKIYFFEYNRPATYYKSNGSQQCTAERYRSLGDLYKLCIFYLPEKTTMEKIISWLCKEVEEGNLCSQYCGAVNKRIFGNHTNKTDYTTTDEFNLKWSDYQTIRKNHLSSIKHRKTVKKI